MTIPFFINSHADGDLTKYLGEYDPGTGEITFTSPVSGKERTMLLGKDFLEYPADTILRFLEQREAMIKDLEHLKKRNNISLV